MKESLLFQASGGLRGLRSRIPLGGMVRCPGFRMRGCMTEIPEERYLCYFCTGTARIVLEMEKNEDPN